MPAKPSKVWFAPKRYGYGSGLPIAWQGWVVLAIYILINSAGVFGLAKMFLDPVAFVAAILIVALISTIILGIICARTTKGGWRWRNGEEP